MYNVPSFGVVNLARNTKDGELEGQGVLKEGSLILGNSYGFESFTETTIKSGFNVKGVVEKDGILTKPAKESLMNMLKKFFSGSRNAGKVLVLDDGMKFKPISMSPADLEFYSKRNLRLKISLDCLKFSLVC